MDVVSPCTCTPGQVPPPAPGTRQCATSTQSGGQSLAFGIPPSTAYAALPARSASVVVVAGQDAHPRAFHRGVGQDDVALEHEAEIDDAEDDQQQQRQDDRELDDLGAPLRCRRFRAFRRNAIVSPADR